jgi:hypothetical protein
VPFGAPIKNRKELTDVIGRAQQALLTPDISPLEFLRGDPPHTARSAKRESFTSNAIVLDIRGPDALNLTFIDLPGECGCLSPTH